MHSRRATYLVLVVLLALSTFFTAKWTGLTAIRDAEETDPSESETGVILEPVRIEALQQSIKAVGTLRANESIVIRPEIAGRIRQILFQEGQAAEKDALLIELDDSELQAELSQATAQLKVSRLTYERLKPLNLEGKRYVTKQQLDEVAGSLQVAQANHVLYSTRLAKTKVRAPFDGLLGIRRVSPGDFVTTGQDLVNLEDVRTLKIDFKVPETLLRHLVPGQSLELTTDAYPGKTFRGTVYVIDPRVDMATRAVQVRAHIPNVEQRLLPGMFAQVTLHLGEKERAMLIPEEAVIPQKDQTFVYRTQDGMARRTAVQLGIRTRGFVQVLSGLQEQDVIVRVGHHKLHDGARIRVVSAIPAR
ncbi:MAG: putative Multidrug efflux transporter, rane fusion protein [Nitrospira sp.]|jgi:membrane fusion protein (multidrug efflux system)|nr:putative Multidrug efflux transporter, rane fusion protein [Nitrospira sp.]